MKRRAAWPCLLVAIALPRCPQAARPSPRHAEPPPPARGTRGLALLQRSAVLRPAAAHPISRGGAGIQRFGEEVGWEGLVPEAPLPRLGPPPAEGPARAAAAAEPRPPREAPPALLQEESAVAGAPSSEAQEEIRAWEAARVASVRQAEAEAVRRARLAGAGEQEALEWMALQLREQARAASARRAEAEAEAALAAQEAAALEVQGPTEAVAGEVHDPSGPLAEPGAGGIGAVAPESPAAAASAGGGEGEAPPRPRRAATPWAARRPRAARAAAEAAGPPPRGAPPDAAPSLGRAAAAAAAEGAAAAAPRRRSGQGRWAIGCAAALLALAAAALLCAAGPAGKAAAWPRLPRAAPRSDADALVRSLPRSTAEEVQGCLADGASARFDCSIAVPASSRRRLRIEAMVAAPARGAAALEAPLSRRCCVLYSASASRGLHDGALPVPVAFASGSQRFLVTLADDPQVRIEVDGGDVSLFCAREGQTRTRRTFADAPDHWQDFVLTHRAAAPGPGERGGWQASSALRADASALEFQECCLLVGARVTLVGELCRGADGALSLRPLQGGGAEAEAELRRAPDGWRTSWERPAPAPGRSDASPTPPSPDSAAACGRRVLVSDDPSLLQHHGP